MATNVVTIVLRNSKVEIERLPWEKWLEAWGADVIQIQARNVEEAHHYEITVTPRELWDGQLKLEEEGSPNQSTRVSSSGPSSSSTGEWTDEEKWNYHEWLIKEATSRLERMNKHRGTR